MGCPTAANLEEAHIVDGPGKSEWPDPFLVGRTKSIVVFTLDGGETLEVQLVRTDYDWEDKSRQLMVFVGYSKRKHSVTHTLISGRYRPDNQSGWVDLPV